jgi:ubiquitin carboxyl-terminal hydrolase 4/11/15
MFLLICVDSHVSKKDQSSVVTSAAYLLFYRRRTDHPLGGPAMEKLLVEADSELQPGSRDASPSGEGQRLGDSSHNGSSSAYPVVQGHRVGDGGLSAVQNPMDRGLTLEDENHSRIQGMNEALPSYNEVIGNEEMLLDEGVDVSRSTNWTSQTWGFDAGLAGHANSDADIMDDNSSTRGEGASPPGHLSDFDEADDSMLYSEDVDDFGRRGMRESAPAPDIQAVHVGTPDDDDDDLPVQELHAGTDGEMQFTPEGAK